MHNIWEVFDECVSKLVIIKWKKLSALRKLKIY
jgi:hypothetical protein